MAALGELRERVAAAYGRLGMPSWPDPHPDSAMPREQEYSRLTEPARYAIVHSRARVWAGVLGDQPGVEVEALAPAPLDDQGRLGRFDRGVRITASRPGTLALLLLERDARPTTGEGPLAVLHISVAEPRIAVQMLPDCGCDACDRGSEDLLDAIDETVGEIIGGPFVALRGNGWHARWHPDGWSASAAGPVQDPARLVTMCRALAAGQDVRLPEDAEAFVGRHPWFG